MVIESVYGDRNHDERDKRRENLKQAVLDIQGRGGTLMIPAFSIQRTQVLLYELNNMIEEREVPEIPVFLDSPLAIKVTNIYKEHTENFNDSVRKEIKAGDDIFDFPKLLFTPKVEDSKAIADVAGPKIVIAGSGMSVGGRIVHHERKYLQDKNSILLLVGYQAAGTAGRRIQDGKKVVKIFNEEIKINAEVRSISGYSSHKDQSNLIEFVENSAPTLEKVFVVMGEPRSSSFLAQRIKDFLGVNAITPKKGDSVEITL